MRPLYLIIFTFPLFSCKDGNNAGKPERPEADFYRLDTTEKAEKLFYPVFELSPKTTAFVVDFTENGTKALLDSIFDQIIHTDSSTATGFMPDCKFYDTSGAYKLMKSEKLESEIRKHYDKEFYIYGTKGNIKASIKAIVFGLDECRTNIVAFCLDDSNLTSIGHPVFCSGKKIDLSYSNKYDNIERAIGSYLSKTPSDYNDSIKLKVMGMPETSTSPTMMIFCGGKRRNQSVSSRQEAFI